MRWSILGLGLLWLVTGAQLRSAEKSPDPCRLLPADSDAVLEVTQPRKLVESVVGLPVWEQLKRFTAFQLAYDSPNTKYALKMLAHLEKELGAPWPVLLDELAGGGLALAVKYGEEPNPALLVLQAKDEKKLAKAVSIFLEVFASLQDTDQPKQQLARKKYQGLEILQVGNDLHVAVVGSALLVSNRSALLQSGLDLHLDAKKKSMLTVRELTQARALLPTESLVRLVINLEYAKKSEQGQQLFQSPPDDPNVTLLLGGWLDVARRSPFFCAGLTQKEQQFTLTLRMPQGRDGAGAVASLHMPTGKQSLKPLLEPTGVLYSTSFHLDLAKIWEERQSLYPAGVVKQLEEGDNQAKKFLLGKSVGELLTQVGATHRVVVVHPQASGYQTKSNQPIPGFAFIASLREPEKFSKSMEGVLRAVALFAGAGVGLQVVEEKRGGAKIVGYRFPENKPLAGDVDNTRFAYSPSFVAVRDQFVFSSTFELAQELVDLLEKEPADAKLTAQPGTAQQAKLYSKGGAELLRSIEDVLVTQTIFDQALPPKLAKEQTDLFLNWLAKLGQVEIDTGYSAKSWHYDITVRLQK